MSGAQGGADEESGELPSSNGLSSSLGGAGQIIDVSDESSNDGEADQLDGLGAWMDQLHVEAAAAQSFFHPSTNGGGYRPFARDGTALHLLAHACDWDRLVDAIDALPRDVALATEKSTGFTFLHRAFAIDYRPGGDTRPPEFPPSRCVEHALRRYPELAWMPAGWGELPLHVAAVSAACGDVLTGRDGAEALVAAHPDAAAHPNQLGETPLNLAIYREWFVRMLLERKPMAASVRSSGGDLPVALNLNGGVDLVGAMLRAHPDAVFERPVRDSKNLLLAHACREGARCDVLTTILQYAGPAQFKIVDQTNPLFQFWRRMCIIGCRHFVAGCDNWRKAELLTKVAYTESIDVDDGGAHLLHAAAGTYSPLQYIQMIAAIYPSQLRERDNRGRLPLMIAASASTDIFSFYPKLLNMELGRNEETETLACEELAEGGERRLQYTCAIDFLLDLFPGAAKISDGSGRVPLCSAISSGKTWDRGVKRLVEAAPEALMARDAKTHLYPCMLAAVGSDSCVDTVFQLLLSHPEVLSPR